MYQSTTILLRKLFENLLIDLLRTKYGSQKVEFFYNTEQNRFLEFYQLIKKNKETKS